MVVSSQMRVSAVCIRPDQLTNLVVAGSNRHGQPEFKGESSHILSYMTGTDTPFGTETVTRPSSEKSSRRRIPATQAGMVVFRIKAENILTYIKKIKELASSIVLHLFCFPGARTS